MQLKQRVLALPIILSALFLISPTWAVELELATANYQEYPHKMQFDGVVEAVKQATISAQTSGRVTEINFDVNDFVPKGSVLIRFRDEEQSSRFKAAKAALSEAEAVLVKDQAENERIKELYTKKLVAKSAQDQAVAALRASEERHKAAKANLAQAQEQLDYTVIKAPYAGILVERHIEVGEMATVGKPLLTGFAVDDMRVSATVPQDFIDLVRQHKQAEVIVEKPRYQRVGSDAITIYPFADPITHTFKVRVGLPGGLEAVYPGMMVKVDFLTGKIKRLVVDARAIAYRSEVTAVYVVKDGVISFRQVRLGKRLDDGSIEVLAGLHAGEQVAVDVVQAGIQLKASRAGE